MKSTKQPCRSELLRLTARVMAIFGIVSSVIFLLMLMAVLGFFYLTGGVFSVTMGALGIGLLLAAGIAEFIAGILGGRSSRTGRKLPACLVWGGLTLALTVAGTLVNLQAMPRHMLLTLLLELVIPVLYLAAAVRAMVAPAPAEESAGTSPAGQTAEEPGLNPAPGKEDGPQE